MEKDSTIFLKNTKNERFIEKMTKFGPIGY